MLISCDVWAQNIKNFSYHWVFNGAKWNCLNGAKILFLQLIKFVSSDDEITVNIDSTLERRKGPKIQGLGRHRDAARSTKSNKVLSISINWLVSALSITLPFTKVKWSLPFLSILMSPEKPLSSSKNTKDLTKRSKHKKMTEWACQIVFVLRRWVGKSRKITIVADSAFACFKLAYACIKNDVGLISRLQLNARLYDFIPENPNKKKKTSGGKCFQSCLYCLKRTYNNGKKLQLNGMGVEQKSFYFIRKMSLVLHRFSPCRYSLGVD